MTGASRQRAAVTSTDEILSEIADVLIEIRDRLPQPTQAERPVAGPVEVSEPAPKRAPDPAAGGASAEVRPAEQDPPKQPRKTQSAKKVSGTSKR